MRISRRTLLVGTGAGVLGVLLASCTREPAPTPTLDRSPTPQPTDAPEGPAPTAFLRSAWTNDPSALGAVSFTPVGVQSTARDALAGSVDDRLFFAGEATDAEAPGTMAGAVRSGLRAAEELLDAAGAGERVAIVGAGLAGAVAAKRLVPTGLELTVFEARDRTGGRVQSIVNDEVWPVPAQLGGWLFGEDDAEIAERLNGLDIRTAALDAALWRSVGDGADVEPPSTQPLTDAIVAAQALPADTSLADALAEAGADPADPALQALLAFVSASAGSDAAQVSSWFPPALPPATRTAVLGDLDDVFAELLDGVRVSLSSAVSRVAYDEAGVSLGIATGESLSFDRVLLTVPLGVLQTGGVEFAPKLPFAHRGAIADLGVGFIETVWLRFDEPILDTEATIWHVIGGDAVIRTWVNLAPVTGDAILVGLVGGADAVAFADLDDEEAQAAAIAALAAFMPEGV
ncbi:FAD-dependent oxidoreductase [Microbacterium sp.]|uniref:flavin monoamine oxidase family protein n=1 Tax=Microbacterium sp. TaxID=51671 RepID=UPI0039E4B838